MPTILGDHTWQRPCRAKGKVQQAGEIMRSVDRDRMIERYVEGPALLQAAVRDVSEADLDLRIGAGWTARQIIHHLADAETIASTRVRRLVTESPVHFVAYDEERWARAAHYERPIGAAMDLVRAVRQSTAEFLRCLTDAEWLREGTHSIVGLYTPEIWLEYYAEHVHDHVAQLCKGRGWTGSALPPIAPARAPGRSPAAVRADEPATAPTATDDNPAPPPGIGDRS